MRVQSKRQFCGKTVNSGAFMRLARDLRRLLHLKKRKSSHAGHRRMTCDLTRSELCPANTRCEERVRAGRTRIAELGSAERDEAAHAGPLSPRLCRSRRRAARRLNTQLRSIGSSKVMTALASQQPLPQGDHLATILAQLERGPYLSRSEGNRSIRQHFRRDDDHGRDKDSHAKARFDAGGENRFISAGKSAEGIGSE